MLAPTTPDDRIAAACATAEGFIYCVSVVGVTGARTSLSSELPQFLGRVRQHTDVPLVVGFGIARPEHVKAVAEHADGVIVASALVDLLADVPAAALGRDGGGICSGNESGLPESGRGVGPGLAP